MKLKKLIRFLEQIAPPTFQESYDNSGLIVGDPQVEIKGVLICLDSVESVLDEAIEKGCNVVLAHHPIVFKGLKRLTGKNYVERVIIKAIKHDIAIYACHTNLDNVKLGVNKRICDKIGLSKTKILAPKRGLIKKLSVHTPTEQADKVRNALFAAGAGHVGNYVETSFNVIGAGTFKAGAGANPFVGKVGERHYEPEVKIDVIYTIEREGRILKAMFDSHPYEEIAYDLIPLTNQHNEIGSGMIGELEDFMDEMDFLKHLKSVMQTDCVKYTALTNNPVRRVAVCGGSGVFLLRSAIAQKADVFITADFKYHEFFDADGKIVVADIGHFESEQFTIDLFYDLITEKFSEKFSNFAVYKTSVNTNPVNYLT